MKIMGPRSGAVGVACAVVVISSVTQADIINVPGDQPTIQAGIDAAINGDQVVVAPGTYRELINFLGKFIRLCSSDGPEVTIINGDIDDDGTGDGTVVRCVNGESALTVLDGFTITRGRGTTKGGGMFNDGTSPTVSNCIFSVNETSPPGGGLGGGMYNNGGNPTVTNCSFEQNSSDGGGGMFNCASSPVVTGCSFSNNFARLGAGLHGDLASSPTVTNCTFSLNAASDRGGGIYITGNWTITNCIFDRNSAQSLGGAMFVQINSDPTVTNCIFSQNTANSGGRAISGSSGTFANCIFWDNASPGVDEIDGTPTVTYSDVLGGFPGMGNISLNPMLIDPDNGDFHLSAGSPCIDAADNTAVPPDEFDLDGDFDFAEPIPFDHDGNPRFVDDPNSPDCQQEPGTCGDPPVVDMGAFEFQKTPPLCPWDCGGDDDGTVSIVDFLGLLAQWGTPGTCDFDGGGVGINDFLELLANWGPCP